MKLPTSAPSSKPVYFPGFNAVRFLAASVVIVHHVEQLKFSAGLTPNLWRNGIIHSLGVQGVNLFFVLSGFLITYLVCEEKQRTGRIAVGRFYVRRALKILPLYFLVAAVALIAAPRLFTGGPPTATNPVLGMLADDVRALHQDYAVKSLLFVFMMPQVALLVYRPVMFISQAWSVGVEEHFYLVWPWVLKISDSKLLKTLVALIVLKVMALWAIVSFPRVLSFGSLHLQMALAFAARYLALFRVECMAVGGVGALVLRRPRLHRYIPRAPGLFFAALVAALAFGGERAMLTSVIYGLALLNLATLPSRGFLRCCLEQRHVRYLGNLSYGLYMYHPIAIVAGLLTATAAAKAQPPAVWNLVVYGTTFASVIALSAVSFHGLEAPLLKLKGRFGSVSAPIPVPSQQSSPGGAGLSAVVLEES